MSENDPAELSGSDGSQSARDNLADALAGLSRVAVGAQSVPTSLTRIAGLAVQAIPGADGAGLTMLETGRSAMVSVSDPFVRAVDDIQYSIGEGPCITAAAEARTVMSGALGDDALWPRFGPRVSALGVHSALSLPLILDDDVVGALNVYARGRDAFTTVAAQLGEMFAVTAAVAVHNARVLMQAQRLAAHLQAALTNRAVIDQAIGIVCSRHGCNAAEGFQRLAVLSQNQNLKLAAVAQAVLDESIRRARVRNTAQDDA